MMESIEQMLLITMIKEFLDLKHVISSSKPKSLLGI